MNWIESGSKPLPSAMLWVEGKEFEVEAILFDKDGTLMDFIYTWGKWGERLLAHFSSGLLERSLPPLSLDLLQLWGIRYDRDKQISGYDRNSPLSMGTVEDLLTLLALEGYKAGLSWAEAKVLAEVCRSAADEELERSRTARLLPGVQPFLEACRQAGLRLGIVTSDETEAAEKHLDWLGIRPYFSVCIGADRVSRGKPYPEMAELACRELGVGPARVAIIGDTEGDMQMARSAGVAAAIALDESQATEREAFPSADAVIAGYHELQLKQVR
ncbi:HAD family hydrolase [Paenibacillus rubinfantis]|uniref:HAD family hydrolase n=1 Tax=Paenibacillus rubinfantis TaxID=1720296 RepID=UPI00073E146E|nr:HAD family hydrolase [Paenibacillus rubinfantis]